MGETITTTVEEYVKNPDLSFSKIITYREDGVNISGSITDIDNQIAEYESTIVILKAKKNKFLEILSRSVKG